MNIIDYRTKYPEVAHIEANDAKFHKYLGLIGAKQWIGRDLEGHDRPSKIKRIWNKICIAFGRQDKYASFRAEHVIPAMLEDLADAKLASYQIILFKTIFSYIPFATKDVRQINLFKRVNDAVLESKFDEKAERVANFIHKPALLNDLKETDYQRPIKEKRKVWSAFGLPKPSTTTLRRALSLDDLTSNNSSNSGTLVIKDSVNTMVIKDQASRYSSETMIIKSTKDSSYSTETMIIKEDTHSSIPTGTVIDRDFKQSHDSVEDLDAMISRESSRNSLANSQFLRDSTQNFQGTAVQRLTRHLPKKASEEFSRCFSRLMKQAQSLESNNSALSRPPSVFNGKKRNNNTPVARLSVIEE